MDEDKAAKLLEAERRELTTLLAHTDEDAGEDREGANEPGDMADPSESLVAEEQDDAVARGLRDRLDAVDRALERLKNGTYGRSLRSGEAIPDDRLEADPAAELTVDEALEA